MWFIACMLNNYILSHTVPKKIWITTYSKTKSVTVGADVTKSTRFCWSGIFLGGQFQKIANFAARKNRRDLKYEYLFFENLQNPSFKIKEKSPKIKFEIKSCLIFFFYSQNYFYLYRGEQKFGFLFSFYFLTS